MSVKRQIIERQRQWALASGLPLCVQGYLPSVEMNLRQQLNPQSRASFEQGSGSELKDSPRGPAKAKAPHSSSVLAINFFDHWVGVDPTPLLHAIGIEGEVVDVRFEEQFPTGLGRIPPNLDVVLKCADGFVFAIESKFTEWLTPKSASKLPLKEKYFEGGAKVWSKVGLNATQRFAERLQGREVAFRYLDAPQLIKHALGLATNLGNRFRLLYIYFDGPCRDESAINHRREVEAFEAELGDELGFLAISYQQLLAHLSKTEGVNPAYLEYLQLRY